ncbi:hypothetical protein [Xylanimonas protaetiae]|uniref:Uncharacterized protein n=1 Tax=Xylanimonas protaetiae TaxID=2509457 RepID=A0A4P6F9G8_9MICO|nr:hypothetical protein [Xylanimonas protaetiae]QAY70007.1 hypothetical protein ET471_08155 [Xylanimonas protaetiae]
MSTTKTSPVKTVYRLSTDEKPGHYLPWLQEHAEQLARRGVNIEQISVNGFFLYEREDGTISMTFREFVLSENGHRMLDTHEQDGWFYGPHARYVARPRGGFIAKSLPPSAVVVPPDDVPADVENPYSGPSLA